MADINDLKNRTVSHGTLNLDHLIPAFCDVLKEYAPDKYAAFIKGYPELDGWEEFLREDWRLVSDDTKMNASDELFDLLNDIAPEGTMFSSTEGDGSDFGFWSVPESFNEDLTPDEDFKIESPFRKVKHSREFNDYRSEVSYEMSKIFDRTGMTDSARDKYYYALTKNYDLIEKLRELWNTDVEEDVAAREAIKFIDSIQERLLDDDEGEMALKKLQGRLSQYKGKTTGQIAADVRYDVATALDMAVDKAEDLMTKFGLDNIYVLRAKGLSPKAIAKKILKADGGKSEAKKYYGYGKDDAIDKEDNDFMWQVAYDWFVDKLPEKLARYADKAVTDVIDKDSRAYEEIVTMDDYYDYLETYGLVVIEEITGDLAESKKTESSGVGLSSIYGDGDVSTHENSADGFYVDEHDPMGFAVLNNDTATMKKLFSGKAVAPEKPWTYAGWHEDTDAPENKDGSYPYVYDWEREYDLNFVNDWKRVVGDKNNEKALELLLQYAPDFIPSAMDFWNAFHAGYSKGLLRKLFDNIFAVVDKDDPYNNFLGYGDYTYDEVAKFLDGKDESRKSDGEDEEAFGKFEDAVKSILMDKYGVVDSHGPSDETANSLVLQYGATLRDAFDKGGEYGYDPTSVALLIITRQLREAPQFFDDCKDFTFNKDSKKSEAKYDRPVTLYATTRFADAEEARRFIRSITNDNISVSTERNGDTVSVSIEGSDEDIDAFLEVYTDNYVFLESDCDVDVMGWTSPDDLKYYTVQGRKELMSESKNESLTLKQKELKDMARYGEAEDITTISDAEAKELKKKGIETVGVSRGTYGMNGALLRDREGNKYVITARSSNLFYFV